MKEKRAFPWQWCPQPERMKVTRFRPTDKAWIPLVASALILSLLAIQGVQVFTPSAVNAFNPNSYSAVFPTAQPTFQTPSQTPQASQASQASQTITSVSTDHFTVQFTFPESADPGNTITISTITTANSNGRIVSLTIDVFSYVGNQLVKSASGTIATDKDVGSGDNWQTSLAVVIPTNAQRGPLIGTVTEVWQEASNYYSSDYSSNYYPNYYSNYYSAYCSDYYRNYYPNYELPHRRYRRLRAIADTPGYRGISSHHPASDNYTAAMQGYLNQDRSVNQPRYVYQQRYVYQPSYLCEPASYYGPNNVPYYGPNYAPYYASNYATQVSSEQTLSLTNVLATTPEYVELQKTNDQLQKDYNDLVAKNNDLSSKYNSLKADYDQTVANYNQLQSDYNSTSQELGNYKIFTYVLIVLAAVLAIALVFVGVYKRRPVVSPDSSTSKKA